MLPFTRTLCALLVVMLVATPLAAQQAHVVERSDLGEMMAERIAEEDAARQQIRHLLERSQVRDVAARAGVSLERVQDAVATLDGDELRVLSQQASEVDRTLAGGQSTVTISTTAIIIILLIVILILVAD